MSVDKLTLLDDTAPPSPKGDIMASTQRKNNGPSGRGVVISGRSKEKTVSPFSHQKRPLCGVEYVPSEDDGGHVGWPQRQGWKRALSQKV